MKRNLRQKFNIRKTLKTQEINSPQKTGRFLFLIPLFIGIIGFVMLLSSSSNYGVGISGDSVSYIMWARNFAENFSFSKSDGSSLIILPPFYSISIACFKLLGMNEFFAARLISSLSFGLIIFISGLWILRYLGSLLFSIICSILILFSNAIVPDCCWAWSEPLFIMFVAFFLFLIPRVIDNPTFKLTFLLGIITSAACLTRYIGVALLPVGAFVLFFGIKQLRKKIVFTFFWGIVSLIPFGIWLIRNHILSGTFMGVRLSYYSPVFQNINTAGDTLRSWFIIGAEKYIPGWLFFTLFSIFVLATLTVYTYKFIKSKETNWAIITVPLFIVSYTTAILYAAINSQLGSFEGRYLSPLYPAITMLIAVFAFKLLGSRKKNIRYITIGGIVIGTSIWLFAGFNYTMATTKHLSKYGFGFASAFWQNSDTIAWLKSNKLNGRIYTNDVWGIYILTDINTCMSPSKPKDENPSQKDKTLKEKGLSEFKSVLETEKNVYLVWFARNIRSYLYVPQQLQDFCDMRLIARLNDGYIIQLYPKNSLHTPAK